MRIAAAAAIALYAVGSPAHADEINVDVRGTMAQVEQILTREGFDVRGFDKRAAPTVEIANCVGNVTLKNCGRVGAYAWRIQTIVLSDREGVQCRDITLAYELTRYAAQLYGLTRAFSATQPLTPDGNQRVLDFETDLARGVAAVVAEDPYRPNCLNAPAWTVGDYRASLD